MQYTPTFEWTEEDNRDLATLKELLVPRVETCLDQFYEWVMTEGPGPRFLTPSTIDRVRTLQQRFWMEFLSSPPSPAYAESRAVIGIRHAEIGLDSQLFLASTRKFQKLLEHELNVSSPSETIRNKLLHVLAKKIEIDITIIIDAYTTHYTAIEKSRSSFTDELITLLDQLTRGNFNVQIPEARTPKDRNFVEALRQLTNTLQTIAQQTREISRGRYTFGPVSSENFLGLALHDMAQALKETAETNEEYTWKLTGINRLSVILRGDSATEVIANNAAQFVGRYVGAPLASIYVYDSESDAYVLTGQHGSSSANKTHIPIGEGYIGQCGTSMEFIEIADIPSDSLPIQTGLGEISPRNLLFAPLHSSTRSIGVLQLATFKPVTLVVRDFLEIAGLALASALESSVSRTTAATLLQNSLSLTTELEAQHDALVTANQELEARTEQLEISETQLRTQQNALRETNKLMQETNKSLRTTEALAQKRNLDLEAARLQIEEKAEALERASQYKSDFLANMSHELRTPLNSVLLLSGHLAENTQGRLDESEVESAEVIHKSGTDLLSLINEVLDLAKIEAGYLEIERQTMDLKNLTAALEQEFGHQAAAKDLEFRTQLSDNSPRELLTDSRRVEQILKNLISNALKFTETGNILIDFNLTRKGKEVSSRMTHETDLLQIDVIDTGIGIAPDQTENIFEAFQQADSGTSRRYSGTGLGLSISRQLAHLLGGELILTQSSEKGSTFTLMIPLVLPDSQIRPPLGPDTTPHQISQHRKTARKQTPETLSTETLDDDRQDLSETDDAVLLIEDDRNFAKFTRDQIRQRGFKCLLAATGEEGIRLAQEHQPSGILLDINLPGIDGWAVLSSLKDDIDTRHIPVHFVSIDEQQPAAFQRGAIGYVSKPTSVIDLNSCLDTISECPRTMHRTLLIAHSNPKVRAKVRGTLDMNGIQFLESEKTAETVQLAATHAPDCIVMGTQLGDGSSYKVISQILAKTSALPPILLFDDAPIDQSELNHFSEYAKANTIVRVHSSERLFDEVSLLFHWAISDLPAQQREIITHVRSSDDCLRGRKILLVEDDMRSAFALSGILINKGMEVQIAEDGELGLKKLESNDFDLILTDVTMPIMNGNEMISRIRQQDQYRNLPILALTANAMKEERSKSIRAGANDYLTKPIDIQKLISAMRVWLFR